jgi:hypothetical protein
VALAAASEPIRIATHSENFLNIRITPRASSEARRLPLR